MVLTVMTTIIIQKMYQQARDGIAQVIMNDGNDNAIYKNIIGCSHINPYSQLHADKNKHHDNSLMMWIQSKMNTKIFTAIWMIYSVITIKSKSMSTRSIVAFSTIVSHILEFKITTQMRLLIHTISQPSINLIHFLALFCIIFLMSCRAQPKKFCS